MPKLVKCPMCGRENPVSNLICSNCGAMLEIAVKEEAPNYPVKKVKEKEVERILKELNINMPKPKERINLDLLKPSELKLFLFVNLVFTSLFLHLLIKYRIIFVFTFYPVLYWFSCYWASRKYFDWQSFIFQFSLIMLIFLSVFFLIPNYLISS
jgi:hypothetical protein